MEKEKYFQKILSFIKNLTKTNYQLSYKERVLLESLYKSRYPVENLEIEIKKRFNQLPAHRKKKFSLMMLKDLKNLKKSKSKIKTKKNFSLKKWEPFIEKHNIPVDLVLEKTDLPEELLEEEIKLRITNFLWKNMSKQEKEKIKKEALNRIKKLKIKIDKEILKAQIRKVIEEIYNIR